MSSQASFHGLPISHIKRPAMTSRCSRNSATALVTRRIRSSSGVFDHSAFCFTANAIARWASSEEIIGAPIICEPSTGTTCGRVVPPLTHSPPIKLRSDEASKASGATARARA